MEKSSVDHPRFGHGNSSRRAFASGSLATGLALGLQPMHAQASNSGENSEISIRKNADLVTLVNIFSVEPQNQGKLFELLTEGTVSLFSRQPGYLSSSFLKSSDGKRVVLYGQWRRPEDIAAFRTRPDVLEYFGRIKALAQFEAIVCEPTFVHHV